MSPQWKMENGRLKPVTGTKNGRSKKQILTAIVIVALLVGVYMIAVKKDSTVGIDENRSSEKPAVKATAVEDTSIFYSKEWPANAFASIMKQWGVSTNPQNLDVGKGYEAVAKANGFTLYFGEVEMKLLSNLGYPAIFEVAESGKTGLIPVVSVWGKRFVTDDDTGMYVDKDWIMKRWTGNVYILWKDFNNVKKTVRLGDRGELVRWVQDTLAELGYTDLGDSGYFGRKTEKAVILFQSINAVESSGEVDPITRMFLYKYLGKYDIPGVLYGLS